jgi:hypothetical protein
LEGGGDRAGYHCGEAGEEGRVRHDRLLALVDRAQLAAQETSGKPQGSRARKQSKP